MTWVINLGILQVKRLDTLNKVLVQSQDYLMTFSVCDCVSYHFEKSQKLVK